MQGFLDAGQLITLVLPCPIISVYRVCVLMCPHHPPLDLICMSVGLCVQVGVHIWLQPVDSVAELGDPLTLYLPPICCVDSANGSHMPRKGIPCVHNA